MRPTEIMIQLYDKTKTKVTALDPCVTPDASEPNSVRGGPNTNEHRDFSRNLISVWGIPIDLINLEDTVNLVHQTVEKSSRLFISTPNLNFTLLSRKDSDFRTSLIQSDLVIIDGTPLLWIGSLLGIKKLDKVSGSDFFEHLSNKLQLQQLTVFFFGADPNIAKRAHQGLNARKSSLRSVGFLDPGFGSAKELSSKRIIEEINSESPDFLVVALGAKKGQEWIQLNRAKLNARVVSHLGAVIAFTAGNTRRAPVFLQKLGLEWLWRVLEEPHLFSRYWLDAMGLLKWLIYSLIPYAILKKRHSKRALRTPSSSKIYISVSTSIDGDSVLLNVSGCMIKRNLRSIQKTFASAVDHPAIHLDLSEVPFIDEFGFGQIMLLMKHAPGKLRIVGASEYASKALNYENLGHLL